MSMKPDQKLLVLRYSTTLEKDCIQKHKEVVDSNGFCWFGKIGSIPSDSMIKAVMAEENPALLLFKKGEGFICDLKEITRTRPTSCFPDYYSVNSLEFSVYFGVSSIEPFPRQLLNQCTVNSTGSSVVDAMFHSRIPYLLASFGDVNLSESDKKRIANGERLSPNDCWYRKDGICNLRSCIMFQSECVRPSRCEKQKT